MLSINKLNGYNTIYEIIKPLKPGGMGEVYLSRDINSDQEVVIKIIHILNDDNISLIENELHLCKSFTHKNIVTTYYTNRFQNGTYDFFYIVMEKITNGNLRNILTNNSQLNFIEIQAYSLQILEGLHEIHKKIVHRDLKPENILFGNELKICDFGLSKFIENQTRTNTFKGWGTYPYMSPECWKTEKNTIRMDIYSLGIIFYELCTLKMPFIGSNSDDFKKQHLYSLFPDISKVRNDIPIKFQQIIYKMVSKRPEDRYSNVQEIINAIQEINQDSNMQINELAKAAQSKIHNQKKIELEELKTKDLNENEDKVLEYSVQWLLKKIEEKINELNNNLEEQKVKFDLNYVSKNNRTSSISFINNFFKISFFNKNEIKNFKEQRRQRSLDFQRQRYRMIMDSPSQTNIEKENVILVGYIQKQDGWGYNFILRKENLQDDYGKWFVCHFDDSAFLAKTNLSYHYPITNSSFFEEYENGRITHVRSVSIQQFDDKIIDEILRKLIT